MKIIYIAEGPGAYSSPFHLSETGEAAHCGADLSARRWQCGPDTPAARAELLHRGQRLCYRCGDIEHRRNSVQPCLTPAQLRDRERWLRWHNLSRGVKA